MSCVAQGKPRPSVRWLKDDQELTADERLYKVTTTASEGHGNVITVNSTLSFLGHARPQTDEIVASDRGKYTCVFVNEVKKVESTMMLKVEHEPIALHQHGKVAYNLRETAEVACKVQAWPKPEFQWSFGTNTASLQGSSSDGHYEISTSSDNYDVYTSVLKITNIRELDYGDYSCRAANAQGSITSTIRLQPKGAPERPVNITAMDVGPTHVALLWELGFDGGLPITKYFVSYRRVPGGDEIVAPDCAVPRPPAGQWLESDCRRSNPCNVTNLEQHQTYTFKVKVYNTKNHSDYSDEVTATTAVAKIPSPLRISYDPESGMLAINVGATCLSLVASIEKNDGPSSSTDESQWRILDEWPLEVLGSAPTQREGVLDDLDALDTTEPRLRVRLCLKADRQKCGEYAEAESNYPHYLFPPIQKFLVVIERHFERYFVCYSRSFVHRSSWGACNANLDCPGGQRRRVLAVRRAVVALLSVSAKARYQGQGLRNGFERVSVREEFYQTVRGEFCLHGLRTRFRCCLLV